MMYKWKPLLKKICKVLGIKRQKNTEKIALALSFTQTSCSLLLYCYSILALNKMRFFFSIWVFFHAHSRSTWQQGKGEGNYITPLYHFHPLHRHLDISREITAESSPLPIAGTQLESGTSSFRAQIANH